MDTNCCRPKACDKKDACNHYIIKPLCGGRLIAEDLSDICLPNYRLYIEGDFYKNFPNKNYETAHDLVQTPVSIKYQPINNPAAILTWLKNKNSLLAENEYLVDLDNAGKKYDVDPLLLLAITGQEQSFVPANWSNTEQMIKNPFNVYGSWQLYAPGFAKSAMIAAQTVNRLSADCPVGMDPIQWINSPDNPNCRYAEDTLWWRGVKKFYEELKSLV